MSTPNEILFLSVFSDSASYQTTLVLKNAATLLDTSLHCQTTDTDGSALGGWLHTKMVYPPADGQSPIQELTGAGVD